MSEARLKLDGLHKDEKVNYMYSNIPVKMVMELLYPKNSVPTSKICPKCNTPVEDKLDEEAFLATTDEGGTYILHEVCVASMIKDASYTIND